MAFVDQQDRAFGQAAEVGDEGLRKIDGWQKIAAVLSRRTSVAA